MGVLNGAKIRVGTKIIHACCSKFSFFILFLDPFIVRYSNLTTTSNAVYLRHKRPHIRKEVTGVR